MRSSTPSPVKAANSPLPHYLVDSQDPRAVREQLEAQLHDIYRLQGESPGLNGVGFTRHVVAASTQQRVQCGSPLHPATPLPHPAAAGTLQHYRNWATQLQARVAAAALLPHTMLLLDPGSRAPPPLPQPSSCSPAASRPSIRLGTRYSTLMLPALPSACT